MAWLPDSERRRQALAWLASGRELVLGDERALPLPVEALRALRAGSPGVEQVQAGGLTAEVLCLAWGGRRWAIKRVWPCCRVANEDGQTSFLNELRRHAELAALRESGQALPGVVAPLWGSLRQGLLVSPWVVARRRRHWSARALRQWLHTSCLLHAQGFFEWDHCPGNVLDDGRQVWLFDFGYQYRFDPLRQFNSAGHGCDHPAHHPAERIQTRNLSAYWLGLEQREGLTVALRHYGLFMRLARAAYRELGRTLAARGAQPEVLAWLAGWVQAWAGLDEHAPAPRLWAAYLPGQWQAHLADVEDDLGGRSCTPLTLARLDWLAWALREHTAPLASLPAWRQRWGPAPSAAADCADWLATATGQARRWQLGHTAQA